MVQPHLVATRDTKLILRGGDIELVWLSEHTRQGKVASIAIQGVKEVQLLKNDPPAPNLNPSANKVRVYSCPGGCPSGLLGDN